MGIQDPAAITDLDAMEKAIGEYVGGLHPVDEARVRFERQYGRERGGNIWMYHVAGPERHGGKAGAGDVYVSRDLPFVSIFATPESELQMLKVHDSKLRPSPEGQARMANLLQESLIREGDVQEQMRLPVRSQTYQMARKQVENPHAMVIREAMESAAQKGRSYPRIAEYLKGAGLMSLLIPVIAGMMFSGKKDAA